MHSPFTDLDFERFIYRQGQLLASRDFRDQQRMEAARRWMHNSALHNIFGVAIGFKFSLTGNTSNTWDREEKLVIRPGIAYDCFGRELILTEPITFRREVFEDGQGNLATGLLNQTHLLVLRYQESTILASNTSHSGTDCFGSKNNLRLSPPLLFFRPKNEVCFGPDVPILSVSFIERDQKVVALVQSYSAAQVRPQARPKIASGRTVTGQTAWKDWMVPESPPIRLGLQVAVDTGYAGFQQPPCYFAWLNGSLFTIREEVSDTPFPVQGSTDVTLFAPLASLAGVTALAPFVSLTKEKPDSFTCRVLLPRMFNNLPPFGQIDPVTANQLGWTVCWLGIET